MAIIKLGEGQYAIRWRDSRGGRHYETLPKGTPHKKVVEIHAQKIVNRDKATPVAGTVAEFCADYLALVGPTLTPLGLERARGIIEHHILPHLGSEIASGLTTKKLKRWRQELKENGACVRRPCSPQTKTPTCARTGKCAVRSECSAPLSDASLDRIYNVFRAIINQAVVNDDIAVSPLKRGAITRLVPANTGRIVYFEPHEWRAFITAIDDEERWKAHVGSTRRKGPEKISAAIDTPRVYGGGRLPDSDATAEYRQRLLAYRPMFRLMLLTASRLSEIRLLTWEQIDLRAGVIHIKQPKVDTPKSLPLDGALRAELAAFPRGFGKTPVFTKPSGDLYAKEEVCRAFGVYRTVAGLRRELTPHSLRHTAASWAAIQGRPLIEIKEMCGHANITTTLKYVHLQPKHLSTTVSTVESMMSATEDAGHAEADHAE